MRQASRCGTHIAATRRLVGAFDARVEQLAGWKDGGDVGVLANAEEHDIKSAVQGSLVVGGGFTRVGEFAAHPVHVISRNRDVVEQCGFGHPVVAVGVVRARAARRPRTAAPEAMECGCATVAADRRALNTIDAASPLRSMRRLRFRAHSRQQRSVVRCVLPHATRVRPHRPRLSVSPLPPVTFDEHVRFGGAHASGGIFSHRLAR